jgi:hypothetical protein
LPSVGRLRLRTRRRTCRAALFRWSAAMGRMWRSKWTQANTHGSSRHHTWGRRRTSQFSEARACRLRARTQGAAGPFQQTFRVVKLVIGVEALLHVPGFERSWRNDLLGVLELHDLFLVGIVSLKMKHCVHGEQCASFRAEGVVCSVSWRHIESSIHAVRCCGPGTVQ